MLETSLAGISSAIDIGGVHVNRTAMIVVIALIVVIVGFVALKLAGRIIVSVATAVALGYLQHWGIIHVW